MRVSRAELLQQLESVSPGLSTRDLVEQSSCFIFKDGDVITYNDEISCRHGTTLKKLVGAVPATPLLSILRKLEEDELELTPGKSELIIAGKRRQAGIRMEAEVLLPIEHVEKPKKWEPLHVDFSEAIQLTQQCASRDQSLFKLTCVHITPKYVEATDNYQIIRYKIKTGLAESTLIRRDNIKHLVDLGMNQFSMTETWAHFRNGNGLIFSCRRSMEDYKDGSETLKQTGVPMTLPKGLGEAVEKARIFSSENVDDDQVLVELRPGKLRIKGIGVSGWYREIKKLKYDGPELSFRIPPALLMDLCNRHNDCEINEDILKVDGGKFVYVTSLGVAEEETKAEKTEVAEEDE